MYKPVVSKVRLHVETIIIQIVFLTQFHLKALDLWMAGCMVFVFAALGEFVVVKVLDVQYQYQLTRQPPKPLPIRLSAMEKGQSIATWDGTNVRSRKATTQVPVNPGQVNV